MIQKMLSRQKILLELKQKIRLRIFATTLSLELVCAISLKSLAKIYENYENFVFAKYETLIFFKQERQ
jgi:hypothetical protein